MKRSLLLFIAAMALAAPRHAWAQARVVQTCGDPSTIGGPLPPGSQAYPTVDVNGRLCALPYSASGGSFYDLVRDAGAKCDGVTNDTVAFQAWLAHKAAGVTLTMPAGTCVIKGYSTGPHANYYTVQGAGAGTTIILYQGTGATGSILQSQGTGGGQEVGALWEGFSIQSTTVMTGGYAIRFNGLSNSIVRDLSADILGSTQAYKGNLCGGVWFNGAANVDLISFGATSLQNCGDGILVNSALGGNAELRILGGNIGGTANTSTSIVSGFINGLHMAGGFGGLRCDGTNFHANQYGLTIDDAITATTNREFVQGPTCVIDTNQYAGVLINDALANGIGTVAALEGPINTTLTGPGVDIRAWANSVVVLDGSRVYNNCGSGILAEDTTANVVIGSAESIIYSGRSALGTGCSTWQTTNGTGTGITGGAVSGTFTHGFGIEALAADTLIKSSATLFSNNPIGNTNANSNVAAPVNCPTGAPTSSFKAQNGVITHC